MWKPDTEYIVYLIGIVVFAVFYYQLKARFESQWLFMVAALTYLLFVRLIGYVVVRVLRSRN